MKKKEERLEKQMADIQAENRRLTEPLQKARSELEDLRRQLANYEKDKQALAVRSLQDNTLVFWSFVRFSIREHLTSTEQNSVYGSCLRVSV